jgi:hypothetical protein
MKFIEFTGEENELEFLKKCYEQWDTIISLSCSDIQKLIKLGALFSEIKHRIGELNGNL